eukprot:135700_1
MADDSDNDTGGGRGRVCLEFPDRPGFGNVGKRVSLRANNFPIELSLESISLYDVVFHPNLPRDASVLIEKEIKRHSRALREIYGAWFSESSRLLCVREVKGTRVFNGSPFRMSVRFVHTLDMAEVTVQEQENILHIILGQCMRKCDLVRFEKNFFENSVRNSEFLRMHDFPEIRLWRGYNTTIQPTVSGLHLKVSVVSRVLHTNPVRSLIDSEIDAVQRAFPTKSRAERVHIMKTRVEEHLMGASVLTRYNKRVYRINRIDWTVSPDDTFIQDDGEEISYRQYFSQRYGIELQCRKPGMIVNIPKQNCSLEDDDRERAIILPPELCYVTGLSRAMRGNSGFMRTLARKIKFAAAYRLHAGEELSERLRQTIATENEQALSTAMEKDFMSSTHVPPFPVRLDTSACLVKGRVLPGVNVAVEFPDEYESKYDEHVLDSRDLRSVWGESWIEAGDETVIQKWALLFEPQDADAASRIRQGILETAETFGVSDRFGEGPDLVCVGMGGEEGEDGDEAKPEHLFWEDALESVVSGGEVQLVVCVLPDEIHVDAVYSSIKNVCCNRYAVVSQCIQGRRIIERHLNTIFRNLVGQILTKTGADPWRVRWELPDKSVDVRGRACMLAGAAASRNWKADQSTVTVGLCASWNRSMSRYMSYVSKQEAGEQLITEMASMMFRALKDFAARTNTLPETIVFFREGVSLWFLKRVYSEEVRAIKRAFCMIKRTSSLAHLTANWDPKLTFAVVLKFCTQRFAQDDGEEAEGHVPAGTVIDGDVTSSALWDFYLIPCKPPTEGCAVTTRYMVLCNDAGFSADDMQAFAHQACSQYFNWPGPVRLPAPCMYASRLAHMYSSMLGDPNPHADLISKPYYI